jgi:hypothetical protein
MSVHSPRTAAAMANVFQAGLSDGTYRKVCAPGCTTEKCSEYCHKYYEYIHKPQQITLGDDQQKWLSKYESINLRQWRCWRGLNDWVYVGDWEVDDDGGYPQRRLNIDSNRYHYWPREEA